MCRGRRAARPYRKTFRCSAAGAIGARAQSDVCGVRAASRRGDVMSDLSAFCPVGLFCRVSRISNGERTSVRSRRVRRGELDVRTQTNDGYTEAAIEAKRKYDLI